MLHRTPDWDKWWALNEHDNEPLGYIKYAEFFIG